MKKNNYPKSLVEVWEWKKKVNEKTKNIPNKIQFFEKDTKEMIEKLGLKRVSYSIKK